MAIPTGTKFQGIPPGNDDLNKRSAQANATAPLYDISEFGGDSTQTVQTLTLQGTTNASTSQAIYGINVIDTATVSNLATRLPDPTTGKQTTFVNNSTMSILVFPSVVGGKINGVVDGVASIPNDGRFYTFFCVDNPLPGAWTWSPPAVNQIQLPRISVAHTNGTGTAAYGVGVSGAQLINPAGANWFDNVSVSGFPTLTFNVISGSAPGRDYWASASNLTPLRTIVNTKVYSNFLASDTSIPSQVPQILRKVAYNTGGGAYANYSASGVSLFGADTVPAGPLNSPVEVGDVGTFYKIQPANLVQVSPTETDKIGVSSTGDHYFTFIISLPQFLATKTYEFDIFLEHT
tara:strand:+ start:495 stop:1538 length:1044 start_codon:yes stop_codon:yes gene_type:complete